MGMIYHYTDAGALINIIRNNTLWASHILHLNDPNEYLLPDRIAREIATEIGHSMSDIYHRGLPHVVCFSKKSDDLNQFRSYANDGKGYAVGFDSQELIKALGLDSSVLQEIIYGEDEIKNFLRERLLADKTQWDAKLQTEKEKLEKEGSQTSTSGFPVLIRPFPTSEVGIYSCKSKYYQEESEVRIIIPPSEISTSLIVKYRSRSYKIIPYIELKSDQPLPIKEIIIGPGHENSTRDITIAAIQDLCFDTQHRNYSVRQSNIDYRPSH